jgi:nitrate reductase beta subunit
MELERLVFFYLPRICNHCLNPGCLAACPQGAIYKRGEDGIVLVSQEKCRGWRMCVSGCPYKKTYFNWESGKAEKCILCYPRQEVQQVPACMHACVGRIRYLGIMLYDADRIREAASRADHELVQAQRELILDPLDSQVIRQAERDGVDEKIIEAAQESPVYKYVKVWKLALPHHPEWRTLPMLFYVPPLLPVVAGCSNGAYELATDFFSSLESARLPIRYMAHLFSAGNEQVVIAAYRKLMAMRLYKRWRTVGDIAAEGVSKAMAEAETTPEELEAIYEMSSMAGFQERFVVPPFLREMAIEALTDTQRQQEEAGTGFRRPPRRGP